MRGILIWLAAVIVCASSAHGQTFGWIPSQPSPRTAHAMAYDSARHATVLFGGRSADNSLLGDTWEWEGSHWTNREVAGPTPRAGHAMAFDSARGVTVLCGGGGGTWEWDGATWTLRTTAGPTPTGDCAMVYDSIRQVSVLFSDGETWEWSGSSWVQRSTTGPPARPGTAMAFDSVRGVTVLFGGGPNGFLMQLRDTWEWNGTVWSQISVTGPSMRTGHTMAFDAARGVTVLYGGQSNYTPFDEVWEWNGASWMLSRTFGDSGRYWGAMVYDTWRQVFVLFGGRTNYPTVTDDTHEWDPTTGAYRYVGNPLATYSNVMAYDSLRHRMVLHNGSETWERTGTTWVNRNVAGPTGPIVLAFDSARGVTVGFEDGAHTWEWDGTNWTERSVSGPSPLLGVGMAFDSVRGVTVLCGADQGPSAETWEWDGQSWSLRASVFPNGATPIPIAFDSQRGLTVVYAQSPSGPALWDWNGAVWLARPTSGPGLSASHMTYDAAHHLLVYNTSVWNGSGWSGTLGQPNSIGVAKPGLAYDSNRQCVVQCGGQRPGTSLRSGSTFELRIVCVPPVPSIVANRVTVCKGGTAILGVTATGTLPAFQWRRQPGSTVIPGEIGAELVISNAGVSDAGLYDCVVSNDCGTVTTETIQLVLCIADFNCSGGLSVADIFAFLNAWFAGDPKANFDGAGGLQVADIFSFLDAWFTGCG